MLSLGCIELLLSGLFPQELIGTLRVFDERGLSLHERNRVVRLPSGIEYETDNLGLRTVERAANGKPSLRILVLGDSFTFGWGLDAEATFVARLQRTADAEFGPGRLLLLNGGHMGWGTSEYVSYVEHYGQGLDVDGLLVFLNAFDIDRSVRRQRYRLRDTTTLTLEERSVVVPGMRVRNLARLIPGYQWLMEHSHLVHLSRKTLIHMQWAEPPSNLESHEGEEASYVILGRALFHRLKELSDARNYRLFVATTGFLEATIQGMETSRHTRAFLADAEKFFTNENVHFHDISKELHEKVKGDYSSLVFPNDPHPNELGARYIADLNWPRIRDWLSAIARK